MVKDLELYNRLAVPANADVQTIRRNFHNLSRSLHPDKTRGDADEYQRISQAYHILKDDDLRRAYDTKGLAGMDRNGTVGRPRFATKKEEITTVTVFHLTLFVLLCLSIGTAIFKLFIAPEHITSVQVQEVFPDPSDISEYNMHNIHPDIQTEDTRYFNQLSGTGEGCYLSRNEVLGHRSLITNEILQMMEKHLESVRTENQVLISEIRRIIDANVRIKEPIQQSETVFLIQDTVLDPCHSELERDQGVNDFQQLQGEEIKSSDNIPNDDRKLLEPQLNEVSNTNTSREFTLKGSFNSIWKYIYEEASNIFNLIISRS